MSWRLQRYYAPRRNGHGRVLVRNCSNSIRSVLFCVFNCLDSLHYSQFWSHLMFLLSFATSKLLIYASFFQMFNVICIEKIHFADFH